MNLYKNITLKYMKNQKKRTILTFIGIILSVALISSILLMYTSALESYTRYAIKTYGDYYVAYKNLPSKFVDDINNNVNVQNTSIKYSFGMAFMGEISKEEREYDNNAPLFRKIDLRAYSDENFKQTPFELEMGNFPKNENEIVLEKNALKFLGSNVKVGDNINLVISSQIDSDSEKDNFKKEYEKKYKLTGIKKSDILTSTNYTSEGITLFDPGTIKEEKLYDLYIKFTSIKDTKDKSNNILENLKIKDYAAKNNIEFSEEFNNDLLRAYQESSNPLSNKAVTNILVVILVIVIIATAAVIYNIFNISVLERISQFGILRCVGASPKQIRKIVLNEALIYCIVGIPIGLTVGAGVVKVLFLLFNKLGKGMFPSDFELYFNIWGILVCIALGIISVVLSVIGPTRHAGKVSSIEAIKNLGSIKKEKIKKSRKLKKKGFTKIIFGIEGLIASKNLRRNRKRYRITIFSMTLSIVLFIVFANFINFYMGVSVFDEDEFGNFQVSNSKGNGENILPKLINDINNVNGVDYIFKNMNSNSNLSKEKPSFFGLGVKEEYMKDKSKEYIKVKNKNGIYSFDVEIVSYGDEALEYLNKHLVKGEIDKNSLNSKNGVLILNKYAIIEKGKRIYTSPFKFEINDSLEIIKDNKETKEVVISGEFNYSLNILYNDYNFFNQFGL
ncbi:MAG: ABC transporter permease [Clostridiales bacterium]